MYKTMLNDVASGFCSYNWVTYVKEILDSIGLSYLWNDQYVVN